MNNALTAELEHHSEGDGSASSSPPASSGPAGRAPTAAASQRAYPTTSTTVEDAPPRSPSRRVGGSTLGAQPPRRTPTRPQPRPLPPPGPEEEEEDIAAPFAGRALHRSPLLNTGVLPAVVREEPELPPTPERPDPVVSTPPSGIHNTPSKRRRDPGEKQIAKQHQGSPSKEQQQQQQHPLSQEVAPDRPPQKEGQRGARGQRRGAGGLVGVVTETSRPLQQVEAAEAEQAKPKSEFVPGTHPRRSVRLRGPGWVKMEERDRLLKEVAQLEVDLELARGENDKAARGIPSAVDKEAVLDLLRRHLLPAGKEPETDSNAQWVDTAMNPIAMLGFNGSTSLDLPPAIPQEGAKDEAEPPPTSHHPIPMTASEELPYLQVFTPLTYTSTIRTISPPAEQPEQATLQKHTIKVRSTTPPGLFSARIEMTVNTRTLAVSSLAVPLLDPAAAAELQPFIESATSSQAPYHPALTRNVSLVCWAMGEWYRVALRRAKFWHALERQLGPDGGKAGLVEVVLGMRAQKKRSRRNRQKERGQYGDGDSDAGAGAGDSFASAESLAGLDSMLFSKGEVLPHMGRTNMDLAIPRLAAEGAQVTSELRVNWGVEFDWAGEARSKLAVEVGVPSKCECSLTNPVLDQNPD